MRFAPTWAGAMRPLHVVLGFILGHRCLPLVRLNGRPGTHSDEISMRQKGLWIRRIRVVQQFSVVDQGTLSYGSHSRALLEFSPVVEFATKHFADAPAWRHTPGGHCNSENAAVRGISCFLRNNYMPCIVVIVVTYYDST